MHIHPFLRAAGAALLFALATGQIDARTVEEAPPDTVCTLLGTALRYVDTTVTVRAVATSQGKTAILSDGQCQGQIALNIDEANSHKRDVSAFRRAITSAGAQASATVFGRFHPTANAGTPYAIDVYSVRDIAEVK
ncbi:hypothetical protein GCM10009552_43340 [Rothia nasimurium]|uniref:Uncharacterized protein n=1 Tax=Luteibacter anthropi TaxID=564369 RepID=A0A7X5ZJI4_9GAMM|nr:hypothetical protein [Luteibacter anthropi]NII07849.1 hypothetical protein [Luteibacter anthropi]